MSKDVIIRKLTSRRLWISVASFVSMIVIALGHSENTATQVTSLIIAGATVLGYVLGEGLVDSAREGNADSTPVSTLPQVSTQNTAPTLPPAPLTVPATIPTPTSPTPTSSAD